MENLVQMVALNTHHIRIESKWQPTIPSKLPAGITRVP